MLGRVDNRYQSVKVNDGNGLVSFLGGVRKVARLRLQWVTPALRTARIAIPAAFVARLRRDVIGALSPGKDAGATHPAPSITSSESIGSATRIQAQANEKPSATMASGVRRMSCVACPSGSSVESRLTPLAICVDRRLSSRSAAHNHSWLTCLEGLPRARSRSRLHDLAFHGRLEHRESIIYQQTSQSHGPSGCLGIRSHAAR